MQPADEQKEFPYKTLHQLALATLVAVILLIFFGALVRASGAGLGCPDWPRCWGSWWPPGSIEEVNFTTLPPEKFPPGVTPADFNLTKMWTEYINRLVGVIIGLFVIATLIRALIPPTTNRFRLAAFAAFVLVVLNGWLGAQVVKSGLKPGMISIHLICAILLMASLVWLVVRTRPPHFQEAPADIPHWIPLGLLGTTVVQILLGARVREALGFLEKSEAAETLPRAEWLAQIPYWTDHLHRLSSWVVAAFALALAVFALRGKLGGLKVQALAIGGLILLQIGFGIALAYAGLPPVFQFLHLACASVLVCLQLYVVFALRESQKAPRERSREALEDPLVPTRANELTFP
ncbi:MAG: COX15/CtaA family protein [Verrucomicrobiota bacterium]